jgi:hypothetical protein
MLGILQAANEKAILDARTSHVRTGAWQSTFSFNYLAQAWFGAAFLASGCRTMSCIRKTMQTKK